VDVGVISAGYPVASLLDLARQIPFRLIPYSESELKALMDSHPYFVRVVIPPGTYHGINTPTLTRGIVTAILWLVKLPYNYVIFENYEDAIKWAKYQIAMIPPRAP
jgi:TRAP-type uncharacterized transport system substrate-binding protein